MAFKNTKTHTLTEIDPKKVKYQVPMRPGKSNTMEFYLPPEIEEKFRELFPVRTNRQIMQLFGIGFSTMQRFKRELGLKKDKAKIIRIQAQMTKKICEKNGYYDSLRGKKPSQQCMDAFHEYLKSPEYKHPIAILREQSPRKYKAKMRKRSEYRKEQIKKERLRYEYGLGQKTKIPLARIGIGKFTKQQVSYRHNMMAKGNYILGDPNPKFGERYTIYYDEATERRPKAESHAEALGFKILPLPKDEAQPAEQTEVHVKVYREKPLSMTLIQ